MSEVERLLKEAEGLLLTTMLRTTDLFERKNLARALDAMHNAQEYVQQAQNLKRCDVEQEPAQKPNDWAKENVWAQQASTYQFSIPGITPEHLQGVRVQPPAAQDYVRATLSPELREKLDAVLLPSTQLPCLPKVSVAELQRIPACDKCMVVSFDKVRQSGARAEELLGWYFASNASGIVKPCEACKMLHGVM